MNSLEKTNGYKIGVDIDGSHITIALVSIQSNTVLKESYYRERVDLHGTKDEIIDTWSKSIINSIGDFEIKDKKIGIAMPGPFDYNNGICLMKGNDKYTALYGLNVKELLSEKLEISVTNISLSNDAGCFLKGEVLSGAAKGYTNVIGIILGTGLGYSYL